VSAGYKALEADYKNSFHWDRYKCNYHWHNGKDFIDPDAFKFEKPQRSQPEETKLWWKQKQAAIYQKFVDTLLVGGTVRQIVVAKEDSPQERAVKKDAAMKALYSDYKSKYIKFSFPKLIIKDSSQETSEKDCTSHY
jgi:hypothetical protein